MEHAQRVMLILACLYTITKGLNPYFNGTCSKSTEESLDLKDKTHVS